MPVPEEALYKIIQDTWTSTLGFQLDCFESVETPAVGALAVCAGITSAWEGEACLRCSPPLARLIAPATF